MNDTSAITQIIESWAAAVAAGNRDGIMAGHSDDLLMFDFPNIVKGLTAHSKTWDFFDDSRRGPVTFRPFGMRVHAAADVAFASCEIHCDGTTAGAFDLRLTTCLEKRAGAWTIVHEHHSVPTKDETLIGPDVGG